MPAHFLHTDADLHKALDRLIEADQNDDSAYCQVRNTMVEYGANPHDATHLELSTIAAWCAAHGLAEMSTFKQFDPLKEALGGERAFFDAVLSHLGLFPSQHDNC